MTGLPKKTVSASKGLIRWSIQEIRHLIVQITQHQMSLNHVLHWSRARRTHQAKAYLSHQNITVVLARAILVVEEIVENAVILPMMRLLETRDPNPELELANADWRQVPPPATFY